MGLFFQVGHHTQAFSLGYRIATLWAAQYTFNQSVLASDTNYSATSKAPAKPIASLSSASAGGPKWGPRGPKKDPAGARRPMVGLGSAAASPSRKFILTLLNGNS
jgi:hypothetical protein